MAKTTLSIESEQQAILSVCDGPLEVQNVLLSLLTEDHFAFDECKLVWTRINTLTKQGKEIPSSIVLQNDPVLSEPAQNLLSDNCTILKRADDAKILAENLEKYRKRRVLLSFSKEVVAELKNGVDDDEYEVRTLDKMEKALLSARSDFNENKIYHVGVNGNTREVIERIGSPDKPKKIKTGFSLFDQKAGGFSRGQLVSLAANTGGGKTVMAMQLSRNFYLHQNLNTCLISFEMDEEECYERIMSGVAQISYDKINLHEMSPTQKTKFYSAFDEFEDHGKNNNCRFSVWAPNSEFTLGQVFTYLKPYKYDALVIDYISLLAQDNAKEDMWSALGKMARMGKMMAKSLNCLVILLAQLSDDNKVRYARAIKEHSNFMWTWNYDDRARETNYIEIEQQKARNVRQFPIPLMANFDIMSFEDWVGEVPASTENQSGEKADRESPKSSMKEMLDDNDL